MVISRFEAVAIWRFISLLLVLLLLVTTTTNAFEITRYNYVFYCSSSTFRRQTTTITKLSSTNSVGDDAITTNVVNKSKDDCNNVFKKNKEQLFVQWMKSNSWKEIPHPGITLKVEGSIPSYVQGTYIKNGPAAFQTPDGTRRYTHAFDGLAKLQKFDINGNNVQFTTRFIDSKIKQSIIESNRIPGHLSIGPVKPPFSLLDILLHTKESDNTCVTVEEISSTGVYVTVTDAEIKMQFDINTLETIGKMKQSKIHNTKGITQLSTAHSKVAKRDGLTYNYYLEIGLLTNYVHIVRTNKDLTRTSIGKVNVGRTKISYVHDISITDNYAIVVLYPLYINLRKVLMNGYLFQSSMEYDSTELTKICIFDLDNKKPVEIFKTQPLWCYHHVNAYEDDEGKVVLDLIAYDTPNIANGPHGYLYMDNMVKEETRIQQEMEGTVWRFIMDINNNNNTSRYVQPDKKLVYYETTGKPWVMELISVAPECQGKSYRYVYGFTGHYEGNNSYMNWAILKQDVEQNISHKIWYEEYQYPGEVTFVKNPNGSDKEEDDGVLLSTVYDSLRNENYLLILNAITMKEIARAYTGIPFPQSFHGKFFPKQLEK